MGKLLSDEELFEYISKVQERIREDGSDHTYNLVGFIQSQKIAHADMVIGEDENERPYGDARKELRPTMRNRLRKEQHERNK